MSLLSILFGGGGGGNTPKAEPVEHNGFLIFPEPMPDGSQFRLAARIEKEIDGEVKTHQLIRADVLNDATSAADAAVSKAKMLIDEQGERLFR